MVHFTMATERRWIRRRGKPPPAGRVAQLHVLGYDEAQVTRQPAASPRKGQAGRSDRGTADADVGARGSKALPDRGAHHAGRADERDAEDRRREPERERDARTQRRRQRRRTRRRQSADPGLDGARRPRRPEPGTPPPTTERRGHTGISRDPECRPPAGSDAPGGRWRSPRPSRS